MNSSRKLQVVILSLLIFLSGCSRNLTSEITSDVTKSSLNHINFSDPISNQFSFIVYGHSYGTALEPDEYPSVTLRNHIDELLEMNPAFVVSLGDMVEEPTSQQFADLDSMVLEKYSMPIFNAVGNHDVENRVLYESLFGENTFYSFIYANAAFIVLDTEINDCYIIGDQLEMLKTSINLALDNKSIDTIYIFMHKVLFMDEYLMNENDSNMVRMNGLQMFQGNNFVEIIDLILMPSAKKKPIYIFAGDVGGFNGNLSPYYQKNGRTNLYMYATGLGDVDNDVVLIVTNNDKEVIVNPYLLSSGEKLNIQDFDEKYWRYYGIDRWKKYRPAIEFGKNCVLDICRVGKDTFHMQCRYFLVLIVGVLFAAGGATFQIIQIRKKKG